MNSVLKAIRNVNQLIVVETDRDILLQKACDTLVEARSYEAAWLGLLENGESFVMVKGSGFRDDISRFSEHVVSGSYPPCIKEMLAGNDMFTIVEKSRECGDCPFKDACSSQEAMVSRVEHSGRLFGMLVVSIAPDIGISEDDEQLLTEVAADIGLALYKMEIEEAHKKIREELQDSEERLSQIVSTNPIPTFVIDMDHTVTHWNKACENLTGYHASEMVGTQKQNLPFYSEERPVLADLVMDGAKEKDISRYYTNKYKKSTLVEGAYEVVDLFPALDDKWLIIKAASLLDQQGKVVGAIETIRDITELKKAEKELKQYSKSLEQMVTVRTKELEDTNQELTDFAYIISHDLKAPLRGINQLASWISSDYAEVLDQDGQEKLSLLISRTKRMHGLIEGVLQYSRIGRAAAEKQSVDFNQLVHETIDILALPENVQISIENELPTVVGVYTLFEQIIQNLLSNAISFIDKPQGFVKIGCVDKKSYWQFSMADNGPGIDEKYFDKIFQMFQTLGPSSEEGGSTGIGLTLVKRIVELHGGHVWLESSVGEGSTFFFTLPKEGVRNERK